MKIALLSEKYTPDVGGLAISAARLAGLLTSAGHRVRVFAPTEGLPPSETRLLNLNGVAVQRFGVHRRADDTLVDWFEALVHEHRRDPFDVLHAYFLSQAGFVAAYAGNYLGAPSVVSARGNDLERAIFDPGRAAHILFALQHASAVTANTRALAEKARALFPRLNVCVIPNGVDAQHFRPMDKSPELARTLSLDSIAVLGFVGELRAKKGMAAILSGYTQVIESRSAALLIVGNVRAGEDQRSLAEFRRANPRARVILTGYVAPAELPAYYALIDIFLHPSRRDGLPNALLEAMACGKAIIATPVGGITDAIVDGESGLMVPVNDPKVLAEAVDNLLANKDLAARLGAAARAAAARYTFKAELDGNLQIYSQLGRTT